MLQPGQCMQWDNGDRVPCLGDGACAINVDVFVLVYNCFWAVLQDSIACLLHYE